MSIINNLKELIPKETRLSWIEYFSSLCILISSRSPSKRLKVGCILVRDNHLISAGYNGFLPGLPHNSIMRDGHEINTVHAEQNAISDAAKRGIPVLGAIAYITHFPCINCCKILLASGIKEVYYLDDYRNDQEVEILFKESGVKFEKIDICDNLII
jgi:dCMP deaminase